MEVKCIADYYTKAELEQAQGGNLISCLNAMGYELEQEGHYYRSKAHSSIVINPVNNQYHWNSKDVHGSKPVELLKQILIHDYHYDEKAAFITAIKRLAGTEGRSLKPDVSFPKNRSPTMEEPQEKGHIQLPKRYKNNNRAIAYLCKTRGLDYSIVKELIKQKKIYETKDYHNACFVSFDQEGIPRHAFLRGTITGKPFKKDIENSDKSCPFILPGRSAANKLYCFESSIDAISHATLYKLSGLDSQDGHRISLHGTSFLGLEQFLQDNPQIEEIVACLDNDETGVRRARKLCIAYKEKGYYPFLQLPKQKDYNADLLQYRQEQEAFTNESQEPEIEELELE